MEVERLGLALRPTVFPPHEILAFIRLLERSSSRLTNIFIPDILTSYDPIEISAAALAVTSRLLIGPGVIRPLEHDQSMLLRRISTLQNLSNSRFVLGVGTGRVGDEPSQSIQRLIHYVEEMKQIASMLNISFPPVYIATLNRGITRRSVGHFDGILMNFCSPEHSARLVAEYSSRKMKADFACYIKLFYSEKREEALRNMIEEFSSYDSMPQYHKLFVLDGVAEDVAEAASNLEKGEIYVPSSLYRISLVNPSPDELSEFVRKYVDAGVTLPVPYPYFSASDGSHYRLRVLNEIASSAYK